MGDETVMKSIGLGISALLLTLSGCAQQGQQSATSDPEAWVDCVFNDRSIGHVQVNDCKAEGGKARAPLQGPEIAYRLTVDWEGHEAPLRGTLYAPEYGHAGSISIILRDIGLNCTGTFRTVKTPRGVWEVDCEDGLMVSGTLHRYDIKHPIVGNGQDSDGNELDFEAWPPSQ